MAGALVLSLDFELHWGVRDHASVAAYRRNLLGVRDAVPALLGCFERRGLACTWATVGMLMAETKRDLVASFPHRLPAYRDGRLSPYAHLAEVGEDERSDPYHFAPSLVRRIVATPRQELASHTFSHFYSLEPGQSAEDFDADLEAYQRVAVRFGGPSRSIVFPRNQVAPAYLDAVRRRGFVAYRSSGSHWAYEARGDETVPRRLFRLGDAYAPLSGARSVPWPEARRGLIDVQGSAFLRPYSHRLRRADALRLRRLTERLRHAAESGSLFHLWWHPHNFGANLAENMRFLEAFLDRFERLRRETGMESLSMGEVAERVGLGVSWQERRQA